MTYSLLHNTYKFGKDRNLDDYGVNVLSSLLLIFLLTKGGYFDILFKH